jgi:biofilm PGA synthesis N-glycosyltransferase PgaC
MIKGHPWLLVMAASTLLLIVVLSITIYLQVYDLGSGALGVLLGNVVLKVISIYLLLFLAVLVIRYLFMMLYSFFEHIEHLSPTKDNQQSPPEEDAFLPMISLVVPAYNEGLVIQAAIRSLLDLDYPNYEVLVIDDGSSDDTYEKSMEVAVASLVVPVRVITKKNGGKSDALNTGTTNARGEFILNMDGDTKLSPNALRACVRHFQNPSVGAVAGNVKVLNRENMLTKIQALEYVEGLAMARKAQSFFRAVNIIPGPLGMFRKSVLQQVGGYDHDTFAEDCDLTLKLLMIGWHIVYEPSAVAWVETPSGWLNLLKQRYRWTRGILQATRKHRWAMWHPRKAGINSFILWYMLFEGIVWPFSTVLGNLFFVFVGLQYGVISLLFFWWLQLTMLDLVAAVYCVVLEDEDPILIPYAVAFRLFYIVIVDVAKVLATIEEWRGTAMTWGKLQREGKL